MWITSRRFQHAAPRDALARHLNANGSAAAINLRRRLTFLAAYSRLKQATSRARTRIARQGRKFVAEDVRSEITADSSVQVKSI